MSYVPVQTMGRTARPALWLDPQRVLLYWSLGLALFGGFGLGALLVAGFAGWLPVAPAAPVLMQVHGQVQAVGFIAVFVLAMGVQLFPRFHATDLRHPGRVTLGGSLLALGVLLRALAQPLAVDTDGRGALLVAAALLQLGGLLLAVSALAQVVMQSEEGPPPGIRKLLPLTMAGSLVLAMVLNLGVAVGLAAGAPVAPYAADEALLHLELWGFAATIIFAVSGRVYPRLLLLQPAREGLMPAALTLWAAGTFGTAAAWLLTDGAPLPLAVAAACQAAGGLLYVAGLRIFSPRRTIDIIPQMTIRMLPWVRTAYGFLVVALLLNAAVAVAGALGVPGGFTVRSAVRHTLAQGFILPVIVFMGALFVNGFNSAMLKRPRALGAMVWLLFAGAALRAGGELLGGYAPGWGSVTALGGWLGTSVFTVFALWVLRSYGHGPIYVRREGPPA